MNKQELFNDVFNAVPKVTFQEAWNNGTGYFDGAASGDNALHLKVGERVASISGNGRKLIIMGTGLSSNIVVFERYSDRQDVFVLHRPNELRTFVNEGSVDSDTMYELIVGETFLPQIFNVFRSAASDILTFTHGKEEGARLFKEKFSQFCN